MSTPSPSPRVGATAALVVVAVVFVVTVVSVLLAFLFAPDGRDLTLVIGPLLGTLAPTIAAVALLVQVRGVQADVSGVQADVSQVRQDTHALTNGLLDSKVRVAVSETVHPDLLHPDVEPTLAADRIVREAAHDGPTP